MKDGTYMFFFLWSIKNREEEEDKLKDHIPLDYVTYRRYVMRFYDTFRDSVSVNVKAVYTNRD